MTQIREWFKNRRLRRHAKMACEHARHVIYYRRDLMRDEEVARIEAIQAGLTKAAADGDFARVEAASSELAGSLKPHVRNGPFASWKEHIEVLAVAIAVAMGFRTYFLQPFKIPTGSMQPTLFGVHSQATTEPSFLYATPILNVIPLMAFGERYRDVKAAETGVAYELRQASHDDPTTKLILIGGTKHRVPRDAQVAKSGVLVDAGTSIWSGIVAAGDHVLVNRLALNFSRPKRGTVVVFNTDNIPTLPTGTHYIKRLIGLPTEEITIREPNVLINGKRVTDSPGITKVETRMDGGYRLAEEAHVGALLRRGASDSYKLESHQYFAMGDNTGNSQDGRYWGHVPEPNMVGPAVFVYWPFTRRWGLIK